MDYKIMSYLKGRLSAEETALFEKEIADDAALRKEVALQRFEMEGMESLVKEDLFKKIAKWEEEETGQAKTPPKTNSKWWRWLRILVPVLLVVVVVVFLIRIYNPPSGSANPSEANPVEEGRKNPVQVPETEKEPVREKIPEKEPPIAKDNKVPNQSLLPPNITEEQIASIVKPLHEAEVDKLEGTTRGGASATVGKADGLFKEGKYLEVIQLLEQAKYDSQDTVNFQGNKELLGHSYFAWGRYAEAAQAFRDIVAQNYGAEFTHPAEWNLLLCLLPNLAKNRAEVDRLLGKMLTTEHIFTPQAKRLQAEMNRR